jgi:hypothetical protein
MSNYTLGELKIECDNCRNDFGCGDCCIMEEIQRIKDVRAQSLNDEELDFECLACPGKNSGCGHCAIFREKDYRNGERFDGRCGDDERDVYHNGSIIKGGGVCRPEWMDDDQWGEYRMSSEYAHEVSYVGFDEPDEDYY